jgi:hypothetical protein
VYRGSKTIESFMPSNDSIINANLMTPLQLSIVLKNLQNNELQYNKFFEFKKNNLTKNFENIALMSYSHPNVICRFLF